MQVKDHRNLSTILATDPSRENRHDAAEAFSTLSTQEVIPNLVKALQTVLHWGMRFKAVIPMQDITDHCVAVRRRHTRIIRIWLALLLVVAVLGPLLATSPTLAGVNHWTSIGPEGGSIIALAAAPNAPVIYAATPNAIFYSSDSGASWSRRSAGLEGQYLNSVLLDPTAPTTAYVGTTDGGVFKTTDSGLSWTPINQGSSFGSVYTLAMDPSVPTTLYAARSFGIDRTTDGGASWHEISDGPGFPETVLGLTVDPTNPAVLYAGTDTGVFRSSDGGVTWARSNTGMPADTRVYQVAVDPGYGQILYAASEAGIYRSLDSGATWSAASTGLTSTWVNTVAVDPQNPNTVYAGTYGGLFRSTNGAGSWSLISGGLPPLSVEAFAFGPGANRYVGAFGAGVYRSTDGGTSWSSASSGLIATDITALALHPSNAAIMYAGIAGGQLLRSTNGGASWEKAMNGLVYNDNLPVPRINVLAINPQTPTTIYAGTPAGPFKSTDGGTSWSSIDPGFLFYVWVNSLVIDPQNPANLYVGSSALFTDGVYRSTNAGSSWTWVTSGLDNTKVLALAIDPQTPTTIYAGTEGGVYRSTNSADNWTAANNGLPSSARIRILAIAPSAPSTLYASNGTTLWRSTDGAASWSEVSHPPGTSRQVRAIVIDPVSTSTLYLGRSDGVYRSTDAGASWERLTTGWPESSTNILALNPLDSATLYAGTSGTGILTYQIVPRPQIATQPGRQTISRGGQATLSVVASDATALSYQWYRGTSGDTTNPVAGATAATFTTPVLEANTTFWVRVTNVYGASSDSTTATVTVVTGFDLSVASSVQVNTPLNVTVRVRDSAGALAPGYRGTVRFSSSDTQAILPPAYTFTPADGGVHNFTVTLRSSGQQTITVEDDAAVSAQVSVAITAPSPPDQPFKLYIPVTSR